MFIRDIIIEDRNIIQKILLLTLLSMLIDTLKFQIQYVVLVLTVSQNNHIKEFSWFELNKIYEWTDDEFLPRYSKRNLFAGSHWLSTLHNLLLRYDKSMTNIIHLMFEINA